MLKHTTTANADHQRTYSNKQQNGSLRNNHVGATTTRISSPEPVLITTPESSDSKATSSARCALEPEYQNTNAAGRVHSPSSSPFFRDTQLNKSVRSVESICATASANNIADSSVQYNKYHNQWNRPGPGGSVKVPLDTSLLQSASSSTRLPSRNSVLNHSYAGIAGYPYQQHQRSFSPNIQQRLNQSEIVGLSAGPPKLFNTSLNLPNGSIGLSGAPKLIANGGLHISKSSNAETKDSLFLDSSRLNSTAIATATVGSNIFGRSYDPDKEETLNGNGGHAVGSSAKNSRNGAAMIASDIFNNGVKEILTSLGLLCLISLLLALLSLIFLLKISPVTAADMKNLLRVEQFTIISPDEYVTVYEVTLALCALSLSLNLCCLLVCSVQFLFAVKLVRSSVDGDRTNKYLQKSSITRVCAIAGFFISIPVFLTGVILYTFIQFHSTPAIITSVLIGSGIVFCGCAMVHNVFIWQKEKTNAVRAIVRRQKIHRQLEASRHSESSTGIGARDTSATALSTMSSLPTARAGMTDLNSVATTPHELSTLV